NVVKQAFSPEDLKATATRLKEIELVDISEVELLVKAIVSEAVANHADCKHYAEIICILCQQMGFCRFPGICQGIRVKDAFMRALISHVQVDFF
ncbi:unnamed protein product, partial [Polarella glacialis]